MTDRIVAVPGVGTKPTHEWTDGADNLWLTGLQAPGIGLFSFDHNIRNSDTGLWQSLLSSGQDLLMSIITLVDSQRVMVPHVIPKYPDLHRISYNIVPSYWSVTV